MAAAWATTPRKRSAQARMNEAWPQAGISHAQRMNDGSPGGETRSERLDALHDSTPTTGRSCPNRRDSPSSTAQQKGGRSPLQLEQPLLRK